ncbi:MAG: NAD+ synthase [Anaerolineae bacterium]
MCPQALESRLTINTGLAEKILVGFVRDAVHKAGFQRGVIGLSGGVDSALSTYIAARALGPENVLAVRMPYATSSADSLADAQAVIDALGVRSLTVAITPFVEPYFQQMPEITPMRRGNVMARMRMIILYDQSAAFDGLVIGTSNKTETLLGYTTLYGDNAAAFQPIGDLYKTQVRQLAEHMGVPPQIIAKPPSADLWAGQTDEAEIGYTYAELDRLLYLLVDARFTPAEAVAEGFPPEMVREVWDRVRANHYKRTMPSVAKLSKRTVGHDFLYLRDWSG